MSDEVSISRLPANYRAMLAICSDLDETPDWQTYWEAMRFLNTMQTTSMGPGLGLEVGNSIYFDMPPGQFAYWNTDETGRAMVRALIRSGHIDCLHSYGDLATGRSDAGRALDELARHHCRLEVWIDHSKAVTNFGADIMRGQGDVPHSPAYHADLTCGFGIRYASRGRVTSMVGQDVPASLGGLFEPRHPVASIRTAAKEAAKRVLAWGGSRKYAMHGPNGVLRRDRLRDGRPIHEFLRSDPYWGGVGEGATGRRLADVLTPSVLEQLVARRGVCVLYTHLGKGATPKEPLAAPARQALRLLADYARDNRILVTTTHRLLRYLAVRESLRFRSERRNGTLVITADALDDPVSGWRRPSPEELEGITFAARHAGPVEVRIGKEHVLPCETSRENGCLLIRLPWQRLEFPSPA